MWQKKNVLEELINHVATQNGEGNDVISPVSLDRWCFFNKQHNYMKRWELSYRINLALNNRKRKPNKEIGDTFSARQHNYVK
ncbi:506_t:CDS:2, partial [Dentiscutata heterogama]